MDLSQALEIASHTDPGMVRSNNEDSIASVPEKGIVVLADGMGGYNAGEVASGMATTVLTTELRQQIEAHAPEEVDPQSGQKAATKMLQQQIAKANASIYQAAQTQPQYAGMGTTLVVALFYDNKVMVAHIGDSRLYRMRGDEFIQVSKDHSLLQEQIDAGMLTKEQAKGSSNKNLVTRAMGIDPAVEPEIHEYDTQPGDIYLLCSDGLSDMVNDEDIGMTLQALGANLNLAVQQLVQMANDNGGRDNVSVILIKILHEYPAGEGLAKKLFGWFR
ncbi:MAG: Stp1/IreP family PP2C-type Ser/Thr phosphatase [Burkholderiales bacterium]|nr:Stp1/IreP family PP2C-type Ser/Thr phosphatase [Burkholderiales bacterium]